jgi:UDP-glucose 4-epimerase
MLLMSVSTIAIFGGTGFIGKHLRRECGRRQLAVWFTDRKNALQPSTLPPQVTTAFYLTHSGISGGASDLSITYEQLLSENLQLLKTAVDQVSQTVRNFIFVSSGGTVYGNTEPQPISEKTTLAPISIYGRIKQAQELWLKEYAQLIGMPYTILRPSNVYGEGQKGNLIGVMIENLHQEKVISIFGNHGVTRDFLYIDDLINAFFKVAERDGAGKTFNVGTGLGTQTTDLIKILQPLMKLSHEPRVEFAPERPGDVAYNVLDTSVFEACYQWKPQTALINGLAHCL